MGAGRAAVQVNCQHPQGVQPWGNYLFAQSRDTRNEGTCRFRHVYEDTPRDKVTYLLQLSANQVFCLIKAPMAAGVLCMLAALPYCIAGLGRLRGLNDELLMQVLTLLPAEALGRLACVNHALYCFSNHEDLWRALTLEATSSHALSLSCVLDMLSL